jgi:hypothetical protein
VGDNDILQFQIFIEFKCIHGKMEMLKFWLKAHVCHRFNNILTIVANGNSINLKWKLDIVECMKSKSKLGKKY